MKLALVLVSDRHFLANAARVARDWPFRVDHLGVNYLRITDAEERTMMFYPWPQSGELDAWDRAVVAAHVSAHVCAYAVESRSEVLVELVLKLLNVSLDLPMWVIDDREVAIPIAEITADTLEM